ARQTAFFRDAVARLARLPGVTSAGAVNWAPLGDRSTTGFHVLDRPVPPPGEEPEADVRFVTPGLLRTMGIPTLAGRDFEEGDGRGRPDVVIVSRALAEQFWPGRDPLGRRIAMEWFRDIEASVVGVAGDVRLESLDKAPPLTLYWPQAQIPNAFMTLMVRTAGPPEAAAPAVRAELAGPDPQVPP